jgi:hypothetical protein
MGMSEQELKLWYNDCDYVIAASVEDAATINAEFHGTTYVPDEDEEWTVRKSDATFTFHQDDGASVTKSVSEWIAEKGRGYFCTSEY